MYDIHYPNGLLIKTATLTGAMEMMEASYPDAVFYDDFGHQIVIEDESTIVDLQTREDARLLCWADEATSANDDGQHAVASIRYDKED